MRNQPNLTVGDLVKVRGECRKYVALNVTHQDLRRGINATRTGIHLFSGFWYPGPVLNKRAHGKIIDPMSAKIQIKGKVRGRIAGLKHLR